jgi:hypothetical protein
MSQTSCSRIALHDRSAAHHYTATESLPLFEPLPDLAATLDRYGKALDPG